MTWEILCQKFLKAYLWYLKFINMLSLTQLVPRLPSHETIGDPGDKAMVYHQLKRPGIMSASIIILSLQFQWYMYCVSSHFRVFTVLLSMHTRLRSWRRHCPSTLVPQSRSQRKTTVSEQAVVSMCQQWTVASYSDHPLKSMGKLVYEANGTVVEHIWTSNIGGVIYTPYQYCLARSGILFGNIT